MSIYRGNVLFDMAIMIHVIIFMHCLQLMKMTEENEREGDTSRVNHTGTNNITTNKVTFLPSITHTSTRNTVRTQTTVTAETEADADTLTHGAHSVVTGLFKSAFASILVMIHVPLK